VAAPQMTPRETEVLLSSLNDQRSHVLGALDGLTDDNLRRPVLPSGWTSIGLVQHLALDVERYWFRNVFAGEAVDQPEDAWHVRPDVPVDDVLALYRHEIELANAFISAMPLDSPPVNWPERWPDWRYEDLREAVLHVITETSCHAGHLDAVRELIDGKTWLVLD
jgi:uncharacterized damage-inducible protein DinB